MQDERKTEDPWIEWSGGECPVEKDAEIEVKWRPFWSPPGWPAPTRHEISRGPAHAVARRWTHDGSAGDIIAYRVVKP